MSHVLIVHTTTEGHTAEIAERMAKAIRDEGNEVQIYNANQPGEHPSLDKFDAILVGGSVHFAAFQSGLVTFVKRNRELLSRVPSAFFSVSLSAADSSEKSSAELQATLDKFFHKTGWRPRKTENIAGALLYTRYNFFIRYIFRQIVKGRGRTEIDTKRDYDLTNWPAVERFAREFSSSIAFPARA